MRNGTGPLIRTEEGVWRAENENTELTSYQTNLLYYLNSLDMLFNKAKEKSEFDYLWALSRLKGIEPEGLDPLETIKDVRDSFEVVNKKIGNWHNTAGNFALFRYGLIVESDEIYRILINLARAANDEAYTTRPFPPVVVSGETYFQTPIQKIKAIKSTCRSAGITLRLFGRFYDNKLRNAIFHSNYYISEGEVHIPGTNRVTYDQEKLLSLLNNTFAFSDALIILLDTHRAEYQDNIEIQGTHHFTGTIAIVIIKEDKGFTGLIERDGPQQAKYRMGIFTPEDMRLINQGTYKLPKSKNTKTQEIIDKFPRRLQPYVGRYYRKKLKP